MNSKNQNFEGEEKYNNIIYYDENIKHYNSINKDSDYFERYTQGAFILCTDLESLRLVRAEILSVYEDDKKITFNLITTGSSFTKIIEFLQEDKRFENCINNVCIYCLNLEKYIPLKYKYNKIHDDIYTRKHQVADFIKMFSSKEIKPFPLIKLITYDEYIKKYKIWHSKVSAFYDDLILESYKKKIEKMHDLINKNSDPKNKNNELEGFLSFDLSKDIKASIAFIINEWTKNSFLGDLKILLMNNKVYNDTEAYFTARLMYGLNKYAQENNKYSEENREFYRGMKMPYSSILPYVRAKGKIIIISAFTSTSEDISIAERFAGRQNSNKLYENNLKFSVLFYIKNIYKKHWISSGINIQNDSYYSQAKEHLFLPFTFCHVKDVKINTNNHTVDIYLEIIGKKEILEEEIKKGKEIEFNKNENIIQVKEK